MKSCFCRDHLYLTFRDHNIFLRQPEYHESIQNGRFTLGEPPLSAEPLIYGILGHFSSPRGKSRLETALSQDDGGPRLRTSASRNARAPCLETAASRDGTPARLETPVSRDDLGASCHLLCPRHPPRLETGASRDGLPRPETGGSRFLRRSRLNR